MHRYSVLKRGESHPDFCEDAIFLYQEESFFVAAVLDGCSSGHKSHFASELGVKILKKICSSSDVPFEDRKPEALGKDILQRFLQELKAAKTSLVLETEEILATLLLMVYCTQQDAAYIAAFGDGAVSVDGEIVCIEQDNTPNYPAYYLEEERHHTFFEEGWERVVLHPTDIAIASDGVNSFISTKPSESIQFSVPEYLMIDKNLLKVPGMLVRKCAILRNEHGLIPYDDLSVVRWVKSIDPIIS